MSAAARAAIAAAAATVPGVKCSPYFRQSTRPGDAMVRLDRIVPDGSGIGQMTTWLVFICLTQDVTEAEKWIDSHTPAITQAFSTVLYVSSIEPRELALDTGRVPVLVITGNRETE